MQEGVIENAEELCRLFVDISVGLEERVDLRSLSGGNLAFNHRREVGYAVHIYRAEREELRHVDIPGALGRAEVAVGYAQLDGLSTCTP